MSVNVDLGRSVRLCRRNCDFLKQLKLVQRSTSIPGQKASTLAEIAGYGYCFDESKHLRHPPSILTSQMHRIFRKYSEIYLACRRQLVRGNEDGRGLSERMASILDHLHLQHPRTVSELARPLRVAESTMS